MDDERGRAAVCGKYCGDCAGLQEGCRGCAYQLGFPPGGECAVFRCCAVERGQEHCGLCPDFACALFLSLGSPLESAKRYRCLTLRVELGTEAWLETKIRPIRKPRS